MNSHLWTFGFFLICFGLLSACTSTLADGTEFEELVAEAQAAVETCLESVTTALDHDDLVGVDFAGVDVFSGSFEISLSQGRITRDAGSGRSGRIYASCVVDQEMQVRAAYYFPSETWPHEPEVSHPHASSPRYFYVEQLIGNSDYSNPSSLGERPSTTLLFSKNQGAIVFRGRVQVPLDW